MNLAAAGKSSHCQPTSSCARKTRTHTQSPSSSDRARYYCAFRHFQRESCCFFHLFVCSLFLFWKGSRYKMADGCADDGLAGFRCGRYDTSFWFIQTRHFFQRWRWSWGSSYSKTCQYFILKWQHRTSDCSYLFSLNHKRLNVGAKVRVPERFAILAISSQKSARRAATPGSLAVSMWPWPTSIPTSLLCHKCGQIIYSAPRFPSFRQ